MRPLVIIAGPTAVGKSELAVKLAKRINGEIISADSMQVYKTMDIGSAKISKEEMEGIPHHLIDILEPNEDFSVALFKEYAIEAVNDIIGRGKIPILVGGTGFYIQALIYDIDFGDISDEPSPYRKELEKIAKDNPPEVLFNELMKVDPESCSIIHMNNVKRVIRALEFFHDTGKPISEHNKEQHENEPAFNFVYFVLNDEREAVYERIDRRVDKMIANGLEQEVKNLVERGLTDKNISMLGLGYHEIYRYLINEISLEEAIYLIKRDTRHFAKKQLTWFKREKETVWINRNEHNQNSDNMLMIMEKILKEKNII